MTYQKSAAERVAGKKCLSGLDISRQEHRQEERSWILANDSSSIERSVCVDIFLISSLYQIALDCIVS
ncbi:hypothetical protein DP117_14580 [Brasilonema sp. UFV-L1]|nr:hypothetical protein [Brasilonema sp. UFV-L1]